MPSQHALPRTDEHFDDCYQWMRDALAHARDEADESLCRLRLRERVCRAEVRELYSELARCSRLGLETVTIEVQLQRRTEESALCRQQAAIMRQHLEALSVRLERAEQIACV